MRRPTILWIALVSAIVTLLAVMTALGVAPASAQDAPFAKPTPTATPTSAPPPAPTVLNPLHGAVTTGTNEPPLGMPTFAWSLPVIAPYYHIQVSNSPGFTVLKVDQDTRGMSYTPTDVWDDGTYYWRVKAGIGTGSNPVWGPYTAIQTFVKDWGDAGTIRPSLINPAADVVRSGFVHGDFQWSPVPGAAGYVFEIATDPLMNNRVYVAESIKAQHTPTVRLTNSNYYWRITPFAYSSSATTRVSGESSEVRRFTIDWSTAPQLLAPDNGLQARFTPRFQWTAVEAAESYVLEVSTDVNFNPANLAEKKVFETHNTDFTPTDALANDKEWFWHVKAIDGAEGNTNWSEVRSFRMAWGAIQLLTPANNQIQLAYPFFSWKSVPGARSYQLQIDNSVDFAAPFIADVEIFNVTNYAQPDWRIVQVSDYYWQVRAKDENGNFGPWSERRAFRISTPTDAVVPSNLIYPPPYYAIDAAETPVQRQMATAWPVFVWDTAVEADYAFTMTYRADYYLLNVDTSPAFNDPSIVVKTANNAAAITADDDVLRKPLVNGQLYFWRVQAFRNGFELGVPSIWEMLYDNTKSELAATATVSLTYPAEGYEAVGTPPVLGWLPVTRTGQYAGSYRVQVSRNPGFTDLVDNVSVPYINFVPWQGHDGPMPIGTYWWRVRVEDGVADAASQWSTPRSFNLAYNLITGNQFDFPHDVLYDPSNTLVAASETTTGDAFELDNLYVMLDRRRNGSLNWVTAFDIHPDGSPVRYWLYFDTDRKTTSSCPAPGNAIGPVYGNIGAYDLFKPEYAISVDWDGSGIVNTNYYRWTGVSFNPNCTWVLVNTLPNIGGIAELNGNAIQLHIPYTALGTADDNFSGNAGITLFSTSASNTSDIMHDTIPAQGVLLANPAGMIDHPAFVSDMLMPLYPFDTPLSNPYTFFDMPALRWRMPIFGSIDGYEVEVARDERFTQRIERWETYENRSSFYFSLLPTAFQSMNVYSDNESYYWRVRIRHEYYTKYATDFDYGPWSPPQRFKLSSRQVGNPRTSTGENVFMTPAFIWDRVEGAAGYSLQIDDDSKFGSPLIDIETPNPSYTPPELNELQSLLSSTQYYWRAAIRRNNDVLGQWTSPMTLTKTSVTPTPIYPLTGDPLTLVTEQPTFLWTGILTPTVEPRLATPKYRLEVDDDPTFGSPSIRIDTAAAGYTPIEGSRQSLADGKWYWRVAIFESSGNPGPFSTAQAFDKQYQVPTLVWPPPNTKAGVMPSFEWLPLTGAAYYRFEISKDSEFEKVQTEDTVNTAYTPTSAFNNGFYFWRVRMFDQDRVAGPTMIGRFNLGYEIFMPKLERSPQ